MEVLGIDVGGSGVKGIPVDTKDGKLLKERLRIPTPQPATPQAIADTVAEIARHFKWRGIIGVGFPAAIRNGVVETAANIDKSWIGTEINTLFKETTGCETFSINDADAAGMAEAKFGEGKKFKKVMVMLTVGTGIGSAVFTKGKLVPNTEFGHLILKNMVAEHYASDAARKNEDLSWDEWGMRFNEYLHLLERLMYPDRFILGGGVSKKFDKFKHTLDVHAEVMPAKLLNHAGIIGASIAAKKALK
ncbi:MAG: ROK family protein [Bacteroidales bacterium]|nr:ROK family protein [Bacteroidales bacterium]